MDVFSALDVFGEVLERVSVYSARDDEVEDCG